MTTTLESSPAVETIASPPQAPASIPKAPRLVSLDVFRGITIAAMILVNYPGHGLAYGPLEHADWNGWTPTDLIFPFFLFIVGVAIPFSQAKRTEGAGQTRKQLLGRIWVRALSLFMLGELLTGFPYTDRDPLPDGWVTLKILRVLCWIFCSVGIVALLIPWKWPRVAMWTPLIITAVFYLMLPIIAWANRHAIAKGLPENFVFGNGMLRP